MAVTASNLKIFMGLENAPSITDNKVNIIIADATARLTGVDDEIAQRYFAAYLLAKSEDWVSLKKDADVEFNIPNPRTYKDLFDERMAEVNTSCCSISFMRCD